MPRIDGEPAVSGKRLATVLRSFVDEEGSVNYDALSLAEDVSRYVESLKVADLTDLESRNARIAFWINAYNMIALYAVIRAIRNKSEFSKYGLRTWGAKVRFFSTDKYNVGGHRLSLRHIENQILRKGLKEPRVHFALVCGAESCPPLKRGLYSAAELEKELDQATQLFVNNPKGCRVDRENKIVYLSKIFDWYSADFGGTQGLLDFVARYHEEGDFLRENKDQLKLRFLDYNWEPNSSQSGEE